MSAGKRPKSLNPHHSSPRPSSGPVQPSSIAATVGTSASPFELAQLADSLPYEQGTDWKDAALLGVGAWADVDNKPRQEGERADQR